MAARKQRKKSRHGRGGAPESPYPSETPLEESGLPKSDVNLSEETVGKIGFDPTSARKSKHFREVLEKRAGGVKNVKWDADPRLKYAQMFAVHPNAKVSVKQIEPHVDESLDDQFVKALPDYGALRKYIKENHWKGEKATYQFEFFSASHPVIGEALTYFDADPEWAEKKEEEMARRQQPQQQNPQYGPPQQNGGYPPPGYGGYPPPGYGGYPPPGQYAYPPPGYGYQPQPPQQGPTIVMPQPIQQQAPMPPPPPPNAGNDVFMQYLITQNEWARQEIARLQAAPQQAPPPQAGAQDWLAWHNAERARWEAEQAQKLAAIPRVEPQAQLSPIDQMKGTVEMIKAVTSMRDAITGPVKEDPPEPKEKEDDGFPILSKQVGPINIIADKKTGAIIQDPILNMMFNAGNLQDGGDRLLKKAEEFFEKHTKAKAEQQEKDLELEKVRQQNMREKAEMMRTLADSQERINRANQQVMNAPAPTQQLQPQPMTQAHAEALAERPTVTVEEVKPEPAPVVRPPPWKRSMVGVDGPPQSEAPPVPVVSAGTATGNGAAEETSVSEPSTSAQPTAPEETVPDTEPPPAPEPAPDASELQTN